MTKQFDIYRNPNPKTVRLAPYVVVLQSDFLNVVDSVVVAPLVSTTKIAVVPRLTPVLALSGQDYALLVHQMAAQPRNALKRVIGSASSLREEILGALDLVFVGF